MIPTLCLFFEVLFQFFVTLTKMIGNKCNNSLVIGEEKTDEYHLLPRQEFPGHLYPDTFSP
jgi:hypothetical protein